MRYRSERGWHAYAVSPIAVLISTLFLTASAGATTFTVTTTADSGAGSLRQAILDANADTTDCTTSTLHDIVFSIPGAGPHVIAPASPLPTIAAGVVIDGYTQPGASPNTLATGTNAVLAVVLSGAAAGASDGIVIGLQAGRPCGPLFTTVRGLVVRNFSGAAIRGSGASSIRIRGNYLGTDAGGASAAGNGSGTSAAIEIGTNTFGWVIGDQDFASGGPSAPIPANRNVISGNVGDAVRTSSANSAQPSQRHSIRGNFIGLAATGTSALGNGRQGIVVDTGSDQLSIEENFIGGNAGNGIDILANATGPFGSHLVRENWVGLTQPLAAAGNQGHGIRVSGADARATIIGTSLFVPHIAHNGGAGVFIENDGKALVRAMAMANNGGLGIDIAPPGVNANDAQDTDSGPNDLQNYPVLTSAVSDGIGGTIQGTLNSTPGTQVSLEFYYSDACDPSGFGEGQSVLRSGGGGGIPTIINVTTDGSGNASFNQAVPVLPPGRFLTAVATRFGSGPGTPLVASEFSACLPIQGPAAAAGSLQFSAATYGVGEGAGPAQVVVTRAGGSAGAVTAQVATSNGTATAPGDYAATSVTVSFADGDTVPKTVSIPIVDDAAVEAAETINVTLSAPTGGATLGTPQAAVVTITDNDVVAPLPTLAIAGVTQSEGNAGTTPFAFAVTLSAPSATAVTVNYITADGSATAGSDYAAASGTLTFAPGAQSQTITVDVLGDTAVEGAEAFTVALSSPSGATLAVPSATGTIVDDDAVAAQPSQIPTLGEWTLVLLAMLLAGLAAPRLRGARSRR